VNLKSLRPPAGIYEVRTIAQSVRRPGIEPGISIFALAGYAANNSYYQSTNQLHYRRRGALKNMHHEGYTNKPLLFVLLLLSFIDLRII